MSHDPTNDPPDDQIERPEKLISDIDSFTKNPNIDEYIRLRKKYPRVGIEYFTSDGIEFLFSDEKLLIENNIDPMVHGGAFEGDGRAHSSLSLNLLTQLRERDARIARGETQLVSTKKAISDAFVNYLIANMLDSLSLQDEAINPDLIVLIKYQLGVLNSEYELKYKKGDERKQAIWIAVTLAAEGKVPSYRKIAAEMGVQPSTVMRWFPDSSMITEAKKLFGELRNVKAVHRRRRK